MSLHKLVEEWREKRDAKIKSSDEHIAEGNIREADRCIGIMDAYRDCADKLEEALGEKCEARHVLRGTTCYDTAAGLALWRKPHTGTIAWSGGDLPATDARRFALAILQACDDAEAATEEASDEC